MFVAGFCHYCQRINNIAGFQYFLLLINKAAHCVSIDSAIIKIKFAIQINTKFHWLYIKMVSNDIGHSQTATPTTASAPDACCVLTFHVAYE